MISSDYDLLLVTQGFPFGNGEQFLETEILYLAQEFKRVVLVPTQIDENERPVPSNVIVEKSFAHSAPHLTISGFVKGARNHIASFGREIFEGILPNASPRAVGRAGRYLTTAHKFSVWLQQYIITEHLDVARTLFYTYWLGASTLGVGFLRKQHPGLHLVSRGHRGDIYETRVIPNYLPFRRATFSSLDLFAAISAHGKAHVDSKYPYALQGSEIHRLGVRDAGMITSASEDSVFRLVSCSFLVPVKRLSLLIEALHHLASQNPQLSIEWSHLGGGMLQAQLEQQAREQLPSNVSWKFYGQLTNQEVMAYYGSHPVDLFINVSESEGIPVSMMEAQNCGIPILATAVGGVPEIVNQANGYLIDSNSSPQQIAQAIHAAIINREEWLQKRQYARETWRILYNADVNYPRFTARLMQLLNQDN